MKRTAQGGDGLSRRPPLMSGALGGLPAAVEMQNLQSTAGNAAVAGLVEGTRPPAPARTPPPETTAAPQQRPLTLPPYLRAMTSAGLSTATGLTGHPFVAAEVTRATGQDGEEVDAIQRELTGRPETFYGRGRAFAVRGTNGASYDVTVAIRPRDEEDAAALSFADSAQGEDADTKVDHLHNSAGTVAADTVRTRRWGGSASGTVLVPTPTPGVLGGAQLAAGAALTSTQDSHSNRTVSEPRTFRSGGGTVTARRRVSYVVRIKQHGARGRQVTSGDGSLVMRVPHEHLVPHGTARPVPGPELSEEQATSVRQAGSMAALAVEDPGGPHGGGGGLFDTVASVLAPSVTAPGAPGRARLFQATAGTTVLQDLPRLLTGWVPGEDLPGKDGSAASAYRMRADIVSLTPGWGAGQTQLRTHQQSAHGAGRTASKGASGLFGAGPAVAVGVPGAPPVARFQGMGSVALKNARFSSSDQSVATRKGAEIRGDKVLYLGRVRLTVQGLGPASPAQRLHPAQRTAEHTLDSWVSLSAQEAQHIGLPLPEGVRADPLRRKPTETAPDGTEREVERRLPFGAVGNSVSLTHLDVRPLVEALERLFASQPELAGYLPDFDTGDRPQGRIPEPEEAEARMRNYRELVTVLSETNLRAKKNQLLGAGVPVRLRRKSTLRSHDVQVRVRGRIGELSYLGDTDNWLVRSSSGVASGGQTGRATARRAGVQGSANVTPLPGALSFGVTANAAVESARRVQGGPAVRGDSLNSGDVRTSTFGTRLMLDAKITMTTRERTLKRSLTPGSRGREQPEARAVASLGDLDAAVPQHFDGTAEGQDVELSTPAALTVGEGEHRRTAARRSRPARFHLASQATGIHDLLTRPPGADTERQVRDWDFVETVGDGRQLQQLAFRLLALAARKGDRDKPGDTAYQAEGLAPRLALEERLGPESVTAALRQATRTGWVVGDLRHARRAAALNGAVGTRLALTGPRVLHRRPEQSGAGGAGVENMVLGGHQASGQHASTKSKAVTFNGTGSERGSGWSLAQSVSPGFGQATTTTDTAATGGTIERNSVHPRSRPLYLVQCDLSAWMVAEVAVNGRGPYAMSQRLTVPGAVGLWLTEQQLRKAGLRTPEERAREQEQALAETAARWRPTPSDRAAVTADPAPEPAPRQAMSEKARGKLPDPTAAELAGRTAGSGSRDVGGQEQQEREARQARQARQERQVAPPVPSRDVSGVPALAAHLPLGAGLVDGMPDFVPLLGRLRAAVRDRALAADLLPDRVLDDRFENVQRLLRVLDQDGSVGLLAGAMDGGVPVELLRNSSVPGRRATSYWAVFHIRRTGPGTVAGPSGNDREMEFATVGYSQRATGTQESLTSGVDVSLTGAGKPHDDLVGSAGAVAGPGAGKTTSSRRAASTRTQTGLRTIVDTEADSVQMTVPFQAELELRSADGRLASVTLDGSLLHRMLDNDLKALARARPERAAEPARGSAAPVRDATAAALAAWRADGARLPLEAQVNGFRGAPQIRELIGRAMAQAHAGTGLRKAGDAAHYAQREAVSTEWLTAALPLLVSAGAQLPPVHVSGLEGQDIDCSLHARLRDGEILGSGDKMTFETVAQSGPEGRPAAADAQHASHHGRSARFMGGEGPVRADYSGMNSIPGTYGRDGGPTDAAANASGTVPLQKPKAASTLVQFTLQVRAVARVRHRHSGALRDPARAVGVQDHTLTYPVVIRMPEPAVRRMAAAAPGGHAPADPHRVLAAADGES
ncbi:hypothetical protein [Streptomyces fuscichromogenes]|uniref:hypothetical protein n=1 Tax=Streptomyces fuscichromogenes TaxID=1324013 RepID=UPI001670E41E|nr:hypothetical protein [Streptomyces fuscichromogenes]